MKSWVIDGGFGIANLKQMERPDPKPGPGQIVVRVRAVSLNFRDLLVTKGMYNPKMPLPRIPCSDGAGEVIAIGDGVSRVKVGDRVAAIFHQKWFSGPISETVARSALGGEIDGMMAEQVLLSEEGVVAIPAHLSYEEAATLPCAAVTAWNALIESGLRPATRYSFRGRAAYRSSRCNSPNSAGRGYSSLPVVMPSCKRPLRSARRRASTTRPTPIGTSGPARKLESASITSSRLAGPARWNAPSRPCAWAATSP